MRYIVLVLLLGGAAFAHETLTTTVLFDREIVRILNSHCVMCHTEGGLAFPLSTYEQTWLQGRKIRAASISRHMPPWAAFPGYGEFANDNGLTLRESQFIVSWVEGLGPRNAGTVFRNLAAGDTERPKEVRAAAVLPHHHMGEPQLTRTLPAANIEPKKANEVRRTVIDLGLAKERWLGGLDFTPGNARVVRAAFFSVQETGQWVGSWTPWYGFSELPAGSAARLPAGSHIVSDIFYQSAGEPVQDRSTLRLYFKDTHDHQVSDLVLKATGPSARLAAQARLAQDTEVLALWPDIAAGITSVEVSARRPDGSTQVLFYGRDFPLDWPTPYIFNAPIALSRDTEISVVAYTTKPAPANSFKLTMSTTAKRKASQ
jgi:hypothetical protein